MLSIAIDEELEKSFGARVSMGIGDDVDVGERGDTGSIITALPAVPVPVSVPVSPRTPARISSVGSGTGAAARTEYRPRTVGAQA